MDSNTASPSGVNGNDHNNNGLTLPSPTRKRTRDHETDVQKQKREKAAARQRRKRERDREANGLGGGGGGGGQGHASLPGEILAALNSTTVEHEQREQELIHQGFLQHHLASASTAPPTSVQTTSASSSTGGGGGGGDYGRGESEAHELTPEEIARRDRVRAGARERQRKHRALLKQKKMRELGLDMDSHPHIQHPGHRPPHAHEMGGHHGGMDEHHPVPHYMPPPHELTGAPPPPPGHPGVHPGHPGHPPPHALVSLPPHPGMVPHEPPFPQGPALGGQTFASTLLLSFSCAPMLKEHLLRSLSMSNEELASLEPIIAEAWDQWDNRRRMHYAEQVARTGTLPPAPYPLEISQEPPSSANSYTPAGTSTNVTTPGSAGPNAEPGTPTNEFRARFHRPLVAPSPFRTTAFASATTQGKTGTKSVSAASASDSTGSSSATTGSIDPDLRPGAKDESAGDGEDEDEKDDANLDPELSGQTGVESNEGEN